MIRIEVQIGNTKVAVQGASPAEAIAQAAFFSELPTECPICGLPVHFSYRTPRDCKYYGLRCDGSPSHETNFGIFKSGDGSLFYKGDWKESYGEGRRGGGSGPDDFWMEDEEPEPTPVRHPAPVRQAPQPARQATPPARKSAAAAPTTSATKQAGPPPTKPQVREKPATEEQKKTSREWVTYGFQAGIVDAAERDALNSELSGSPSERACLEMCESIRQRSEAA